MKIGAQDRNTVGTTTSDQIIYLGHIVLLLGISAGEVVGIVVGSRVKRRGEYGLLHHLRDGRCHHWHLKGLD